MFDIFVRLIAVLFIFLILFYCVHFAEKSV